MSMSKTRVPFPMSGRYRFLLCFPQKIDELSTSERCACAGWANIEVRRSLSRILPEKYGKLEKSYIPVKVHYLRQGKRHFPLLLFPSNPTSHDNEDWDRVATYLKCVSYNRCSCCSNKNRFSVKISLRLLMDLDNCCSDLCYGRYTVCKAIGSYGNQCGHFPEYWG